MKKWMFAGAAIAAMMASGLAHAEGGYVGALYSNADAEGISESSSFGVDGAAAFGESVTFEADAVISGDGAGVTAHLYKRTDRFLVGAYAGYTDGDETATTEYGAEGNLYFDRLTIGGAYGQVEFDLGGFDVDSSGYSLEARLFPTDNIRLQGGIGGATADIGYLSDVDFTTYGVGGEIRLGDSPVSALVSWARAEADDFDTSVDTLTFGIRYNWGGSLLDRDRHGAGQGHTSVAGAFVF